MTYVRIRASDSTSKLEDQNQDQDKQWIVEISDVGLVVIVEFLLGKHQCIASTVELDQNQIKGEWPHQEVGSHLVSLIKNGN